MNDRLILIVGTTHPIQMGAWGAEPCICKAFKGQLIKWCRNEKVEAIAEEMNAPARKRAQEEGSAQSDKTIPQQAAEALGLEHMDCDDAPDIPDITTVRCIALSSGRDEAKELKNRDAKRECHWMERLVSWRKNKMLFVCGNKHVRSFQERLNGRNIKAKILAENWTSQQKH